MVRFADQISLHTPPLIQQVCQQLEQQLGDRLIDLIPSYTTLLVIYDSLKIDSNQCQQKVETAIKAAQNLPGLGDFQTHILPVCYSLGLDLANLAESKQLSSRQIIDLHCQPTYLVCAIGFSPAFAYLGEVLPQLATPRHAEPRLKIPAGSVGIADTQTAVYPIESPAGWQIIGRTPLDLSLKHPQNLTRFKVGDRVQFEPISLDQFKQLEGRL